MRQIWEALHPESAATSLQPAVDVSHVLPYHAPLHCFHKFKNTGLLVLFTGTVQMEEGLCMVLLKRIHTFEYVCTKR